MNPIRPDVLEFASEDHEYQLEIPLPPKQAALKWEEKHYKWPEIDNPHPKIVLFNSAKDQIIFLGGLGDPGTELGHIYIYSKQGDLLKAIDLKAEMHDLEHLSRRWRELTNFPWLAAAELSFDEENLLLWVCRKKKVTIDLDTFSISVTRSSDPSPWKEVNPVSNKGMN